MPRWLLLLLPLVVLLGPVTLPRSVLGQPMLTDRGVPIGPPHVVSIITDRPRDLFDQDARRAAAGLDRLVGDQLGHERQLGLGPFLVLELPELPLTWEKAPDRIQRSLERAFGADAPDAYERRVARVLLGILQRLESRRGDRLVGVLGLPQEPGPGRDAERSNANYADVIARLGVLASEESFIRVGGGVAVAGVNPRAELEHAWRMRGGRPIVYRVNRKWAMLARDEDAESVERRGARIAEADRATRVIDARVAVLLEDGLGAALAIARDAEPRRAAEAGSGADHRRIVDAEALRRDRDGDGTPDALDGCPDDPNKVEPGDCGCGNPETDRDEDGWPDCIDECPDDPFKREPGDCGCGFSERDADEDGVADCHDGCPDDPFKFAPGACGCGVPESAGCDEIDGWTPLVPVVGSADPEDDTRILYVSSTIGSDMRRYRWYGAGDPLVGGDPTRPVGQVEAYRTIQQAMAYLRSDKPDWILVRRGDVLEEDFVPWARSGASADRPAVLATWRTPGQSRDDRPVIRTGRSGGVIGRGHHPRRFVVVSGLRFEPADDQARSSPAILWEAPGDGIVFEDVQIEGYACGIRIALPGRGALRGVHLRRVQLLGPPRGVARSVGVEVEGVSSLVIDESLFTAPLRAAANGHVHLSVDQTSDEVVVRRSAFLGGAATGCVQASGGRHEGNLHAGSTVALVFGPEAGVADPVGGLVRNNVVRGDPVGPAVNGLVGIRLRDVNGVTVDGNLLAAGTAGDGGAAIEVAGRFRGLRIAANEIAGWSSPAATGTAVRISGTSFGDARIERNRLQQPDGGAVIAITSGAARNGIEFSGNRVFSSSPAESWFEPFGDPRRWRQDAPEPDLVVAGEEGPQPLRNLAGWTDAVHLRVDGVAVTRLDPDRFLEPGLAELLVELRRQGRGGWRDDLAAPRLASWIREGLSAEESAAERISDAAGRD